MFVNVNTLVCAKTIVKNLSAVQGLEDEIERLSKNCYYKIHWSSQYGEQGIANPRNQLSSTKSAYKIKSMGHMHNFSLL